MSITLNMTSAETENLIKRFEKAQIPTKNAYQKAIFKLDGCTITVYNSLKVVFQGSNELIYANEFISSFDEMVCIGSDEVGTGDVFGPVVVSAFYYEPSIKMKLLKLGVKDSKNLTDEKIMIIAEELIKENRHIKLICDNDKFNEMTDKGFNMNKIKAYLHNHAYKKILSKYNKYDFIIQDQFTTPDSYFRYLENEETVKNITFKVKGESISLAVAAASIIARYYFLISFKELEERYNVKLHKGAGSLVDEDIKKIDKNILPHIAKVNFKNIKKTN